MSEEPVNTADVPTPPPTKVIAESGGEQAPAESAATSCRWPTGCKVPAAPKEPGKTGPAPIYCYTAPDGATVHNPGTALRMREKMRRQGKGEPVTEDPRSAKQ